MNINKFGSIKYIGNYAFVSTYVSFTQFDLSRNGYKMHRYQYNFGTQPECDFQINLSTNFTLTLTSMKKSKVFYLFKFNGSYLCGDGNQSCNTCDNINPTEYRK